MSRLLSHLPSLYKDIREFRELSGTVTKELDVVDVTLQQIEDDQFVMTSSEPAVVRRENEYEILPDRKVESIEFRKKRLISHMQSKPPFVLEYLRHIFDSMFGKQMHEIELDTLLFEMEVLVQIEGAVYFDEMARILERIVPLNILFKLISRMQTKLYFASSTLTGEEITVYPWQETNLETKGTVKFETASQSVEKIAIYPQ